MSSYYYYDTSAGSFLITEIDGWWYVLLEDQDLGKYATPKEAAEDLVAGRAFPPDHCIVISELGIPRDIYEWNSDEWDYKVNRKILFF